MYPEYMCGYGSSRGVDDVFIWYRGPLFVLCPFQRLPASTVENQFRVVLIISGYDFTDRKLGTWSTAFLIINRVVGAGIFSTPAEIIRLTDSVGATLLFWVLGGFMTFW